ncbi:hypothetical protein [Histophilus somni]|nr:hypothetical protein [Histophilus somni]
MARRRKTVEEKATAIAEINEKIKQTEINALKTLITLKIWEN